MIRANFRARLWADLSLLGVTAVWGATFVMVKEALAGVGPLTFVAFRFTLAMLVLAPAVAWRRPKRSAGLVPAGALAGLFLFAGYALQTAGLQYTSASKAGFITGLSVVIVPLLGGLALRQAPGRATVVGIALAVLGLGLLSLRGELGAELGDLLVLGCALAFALHILVLDRLAPRHDILALTAGQIAATALLTAGLAGLVERPTVAQLIEVWPAALFTGVFATVAAFYFQTQAQRLTTAAHTALIFSMEPVFAGLFGYLLAGERLDGRAVVGCACILGGMLIAQLAPDHRPPAHEPFG